MMEQMEIEGERIERMEIERQEIERQNREPTPPRIKKNFHLMRIYKKNMEF
jgi:hypothetical protein